MRWLVMLLMSLALLSRAADAPAEFAAGNQAYEQGKFAEAAIHYRAALSNNAATANVWFNLGNAEYKAGELGRAIAAYRRAEQLTPRNSALRANLNFVRRKAAGEQSRLPLATTLLRFLTPNEWTVMASIALALAFAALVLGEVRRTSSRGIVATLLTCTLLLGVAAGASYRDRHTLRQAVVVSKQSAVRYGPLEESQTAFSLNDGAEFVITDNSSNWFQVRLADGRSGWLKSSDVTFVTP
jgi:tetratricopeptide (TPR) repeat protein